MKVKELSCVQLLATSWTATYQAPPSMGFSRQEYWSGVLGELTSLDAHGEFGGSGAGSSSPSSSSLCTEPLIPTTPIIPSEEMAKIACSLALQPSTPQ